MYKINGHLGDIKNIVGHPYLYVEGIIVDVCLYVYVSEKRGHNTGNFFSKFCYIYSHIARKFNIFNVHEVTLFTNQQQNSCRVSDFHYGGCIHGSWYQLWTGRK